MNAADAFARLKRFTDLAGGAYGTEDLALLLYSIVKMERARNVVELGTGLGVSAAWMAQAMRENGEGTVWSIDDGSHFARPEAMEVLRRVAAETFARPDSGDASHAGFLDGLRREFALEDHLRFVRHTLDPRSPTDAPRAAETFLARPIDLVWSDFAHSAEAVYWIVGAFLPHLAESASVLIDSVSTRVGPCLAAERLVAQLNAGKLPASLLAPLSPELRERVAAIVPRRQFQLVHLVERKLRDQNGTAWIRVAPIDVVPFDRSLLRG